MTTAARKLLLRRITRADGELSDHGEAIAEELHRPTSWSQDDVEDSEPEPYPDSCLY